MSQSVYSGDGTDTIRRRLIFEDDGWCIYRWDDHADYQWGHRFTMWHKCGIERDHAIKKLRYASSHVCVRCDIGPPDGMVGLYEMLNWDKEPR